jgi:leader peptidase (prepilin peptidase)/N-methyltransferase
MQGMRVTEPAQATVAAPAPFAAVQPARLASAAAGVVASGLVLAHFGFDERALTGVLFVSALAVLAAVDIERHLLPNRIVLPSFAVVLVAQLVLVPDRSLEWIGASLGTALLLLIAALIKPGGLGFGDVKLGLLLGAGLGKGVITALAVGIFAIWPVAVYLYARHGRAAGKLALPFGPFLALGAVVALLTA